MPATSTPADRLDLASGITIRTCSRCSTEAELNERNFFHRHYADGRVWIDRRCQTCRRLVDAENRRNRRSRRVGDERRFGVEIETVGASSSAIVREMIARGLDCSFEGYTHRIRAGAWKVVTDASVTGGYEIVSPPLRGEAGLDEVRKACEALQAAGARVDRRCGLHVHHDVADLDVDSFKRLFRGWNNSQRAIDGLVSASRRGSNWAMPHNERDLERIDSLRELNASSIQNLYMDRYYSLNLACFPRYGTVEVRQHQGSVNGAKIVAWILFGQAMVRRAIAGTTTGFTTAAQLVRTLADFGLPTATRDYLIRRADAFAGSPVGA